jgi:signal peptidase I
MHEIMEVQNQESFWKETLKLVILALVVVIPFRIYIAQPFIVEGASMDPTFKTGQYLIVDKLTYQFSEPERGSVLIFRYPKNPKKYFIKRVIGLPGETVNIENGKVRITNSENPEGFVLDEPYVAYSTKDNLNRKLGENEYFVLGDNRPASADSRLWGTVPKENIIGRPAVRFYPPALWPGNYEEINKK